jgi:hypothetical protein
LFTSLGKSGSLQTWLEHFIIREGRQPEAIAELYTPIPQ